MTASTLESRLRQISILVASVDTSAARQLLMHLPTEIAQRVRAMAADIGPIPPEERRALLAEFQKSQVQLRSNTGQAHPVNESSPIPQAATSHSFPDLASQFHSVSNHAPESSAPSWTRLGVDALVRLVRTERPTVIAVVLQQLPATQVAAVLQRLPQLTTKDTLRALGSLQDIDEEAMRTIDEHLSEKLRDYHHKIESELEQTKRMNDLLAAAPPEMKQQWASWIRPDTFLEESPSRPDRPISATASAMNTLDDLYRSASVTTSDLQWMSESGPATGPENQSEIHFTPNEGVPLPVQPTQKSNISSTDLVTNSRAADDEPHTIPFPGVSSPGQMQSTNVVDRSELQRNMDRLLTLSPESLAQLLSSLDSQTILLALAGASTHFMKRFRGMLVSGDAKLLDERIRRIGPITLRQIDEAQQRLISTYLAHLTSTSLGRAA